MRDQRQKSGPPAPGLFEPGPFKSRKPPKVHRGLFERAATYIRDYDPFVKPVKARAKKRPPAPIRRGA